MIGANIFLFQAFGIAVSPFQVLGILAVTWVSCFVSPSPNGIGIADLAPSFLLSSMGYRDYAGGFITVNRSIDVAIILFWITAGFLAVRIHRARAERRKIQELKRAAARLEKGAGPPVGIVEEEVLG